MNTLWLIVPHAINIALNGIALWYLYWFNRRDKNRKELIDALSEAYLKKHDPRQCDG